MDSFNFSDFISSLTEGFTPVIDTKFKLKDYVKIDLSQANKALKDMKIPSAPKFKKYIDDKVSKQKGKVAYGGYNEKRNIYQQSVIFNNEKTPSPREIHIGLDIWCDVGTAVLAPLEGTVHSFSDNEGLGNYGPTIVLEHIIADKTFYTLYGHLKKRSIINLSFGQIVEAGDKIAEVGSPKVNGGYAPHLHFQIIDDLQGSSGDYPGVVAKEDLDLYMQNCPNPNLFLKIG